MALESRIDDLYKKALDEFVASRSALASELKGADAQRVKQLKKPTAVPWAVNQVYWHARHIFDRLQRSGAELRRAQLEALKGRSTELRAATEAHRNALSAAVKDAVRFGEASRLRPSRDALMRTFEALSLATTPPEPHGRLTHPLQPGGFEMLAGVPVNARLEPRATKPRRPNAPEHPSPARHSAETLKPADAKQHAGEQRAAAAAARARERESRVAARRRAAAIKKAEATLASAREREAQASLAWERAKEDLEKARRVLATLQS